MVIKNGDVVKIDYILMDEEGKIIYSSEKDTDNPVKIHIGTAQVLLALENQLIGMEKGEEKEFTLTPQEAYGEFNPLLVEKIPKEKVMEEMNLELGQQIEVMSPNGMSSPGWVRLIEDDYIFVDMNPPLAGRALHFKIKIRETNLNPDPQPNPFLFGISCGDSCDHDHGEQDKIKL